MRVRWRFSLSVLVVCGLGYGIAELSLAALAAQGRGGSSGGTLTPPAVYPHDMTAYNCSHYDEKACDQAPAPPPLYDPLVGQWVRYTLIRNGFSVQPPDAPLYVQFGPDGYWSMMEFPANRPKVNKPL